MKKCKVCAQNKEAAEYHPNRDWCKTCYNKSTRNAKYMRRYGITAEEADRLKKERGCEICGSEEHLHVDHNHETGKFRGILCGTCNRGIGSLGDNPGLLMKAAQYLIEKGHYGKESRKTKGREAPEGAPKGSGSDNEGLPHENAEVPPVAQGASGSI